MLKEIYLAGGCFWGTQAFFDRITGVKHTDVGYANGKTESTDYELIKDTGHVETVHVVYDSRQISLESILELYFSIIDPTILNRQGNDIGTQYRTGIYYIDKQDKEIINMIIEKKSKEYTKKIVTEVKVLKNYILAENCHQDYLEKNPNGYCHINLSNIPSKYLNTDKEKFAKPSKNEIKDLLTKEQFTVTQEGGTEPPFENEYWNNKEKGIYVDIVTGEPLFVSSSKYDSSCGWPSFTKPIDDKRVIFKKDASYGMDRIEVKSSIGESHLGHVFHDGPVKDGGLRYCINSASLRFISLSEMDNEGYGDFKALVE